MDNNDDALTLDKIMAARRLMDSLGPPLPKLRIVESWFLCDRIQVKFPRSKAKRIRKKWAKRESNWQSAPSRDVYKTGDMIVCHPTIAAQIRKTMGGSTWT